MTKNRVSNRISSPLFLGIEGGGTRTLAIMADAAGNFVRRVEAGPANLRLLSNRQLGRHFRLLARAFPKPSALGIGLAGVRSQEDQERILNAAALAWPGVICGATHDLETALFAAERMADTQPVTRVIVLSGTGSCCFGRTPAGKTAKVGGWGHFLGDKGSGYEIGLRALKAVVYYYDRDGVWSSLGQRILRILQLNEPNDLIHWAQNAEKKEIAALAVEVFASWLRHDMIATDILHGAAESLAKDAVSCAKRLVGTGRKVEFVFAGSVLLKQPRFSELVARQLRQLWPRSKSAPLKVESVWGAVALAKMEFELQSAPPASKLRKVGNRKIEPLPSTAFDPGNSRPPAVTISQSPLLSPTEQRNPRSANLHRLSVAQGVDLMLKEEGRVAAALLKEKECIARAIQWIVRAFRRKGRLFYVGAGTSGRLGVLDASECPPTFRAPPEQVQGIIAGGQGALWSSVEGAEDDAAAGARAIQFRGIKRNDVVVGIAASGRTPFVWGALQEARRRRARTILVCFNPYLEIPRPLAPDMVIAPNLGPEVLTGSTRLKAGTATKLILNMFSTLSMVQIGKVVGNLMVDLNPSNTKLRDRAVRIVQELTGSDYSTALQALEKSAWVVAKAWRKLS
jgi:N-acetylmuramic acid 6-phosphate etherase